MEIEDVLAHGGWRLVDPRPAARENPDTFEMPTAEELAGMQPGSTIRAMFEMTTIVDQSSDGESPYDARGRPVLILGTERMWLVVLGRTDEGFLAVLDNQPLATHTRLRMGVRLNIPATHVIATDDGPPDLDEYLAELDELFPPVDEVAATEPQDPDAAPNVYPEWAASCSESEVLPHPPGVFSNMLVAKDLGPDHDVVYGGRFEPIPERWDNGWVVWASYDDMEHAASEVGFEIVRTQEVHRRCPAAWRFLALPPGWGFTVPSGADGEAYPIEIED